ncbi:unnamed protein product [Effrenium voratum]|nr:unnamed protein product [Effrenium voratum]
MSGKLTLGHLAATSAKGSATPSTAASTPKSRSVFRAQTLGALALQVFQAPCPSVVKVTVEGKLDASVKVQVPGAKMEGSGLPALCRAGKTWTVTFLSSSAARGPMTKGSLMIQGFDAVPFCVAHNDQGHTFVQSKGKWRYTALSAPRWNWRENAEKPTEGTAADLEVIGARSADSVPHLKVHVRSASEVELKRCLQGLALREAQAEEDYDMLLAQVTKAKTAGVDREQIEQAEERLRGMRKMGKHVNDGCDKESLKLLMQWEKVTRCGETGVNETCKASPDCPCNEEVNCGEVLSIVPSAVQLLLKDFGPEGDKELFDELSASALAVEEGSVWKAGGKLIFSAFDRNQSVQALTRMLNNVGRARCVKMLLQMVKHSEAEYGGFVTAIQINFHPNGESFHAQHRDIYSAKQRAGPSCTCTFKKCVGTVCYTVGSSRQVLLETMTDMFSAVKPCGEHCTGRRERRWLHSGDAMYFNEAWNANHTHGIPPIDGESGPRISVAFLLGAEESRIYQKMLLPNEVPQ